jgi:hypothetical protein
MSRIRWGTAAFTILLSAACGDDPASPGGVTMSDLAGSWQVTRWEYTNSANSSESVDLVTLAGSSATLDLEDTGDYTISGTLAGVAVTLTGTWTISGSNMQILEDGTVDTQTTPFSLSGDTLTLSGLEGDWDFDDDGTDDPASLIVVFTRQ